MCVKTLLSNQVFQVSEGMKESVPEHVKRAAREMGEKAFRQRLREINMSPFEHEVSILVYFSSLN